MQNKCVSITHIRSMGVQLKLCATTRTFKGNISVANCMPLYLLKTGTDRVGYEKIAILDKYLVDHCWCWTVHLGGTVQAIACDRRLSRATNAAKPHISESCL